jgi:hypothetical protein
MRTGRLRQTLAVERAVDLSELARLPGAVDQNFEALTRAIVSRRYGHLATIRERRNQPGVEFYLRVDHPGALGDPGRVWGWSCKWLTLGPKNELTKAQRDQIEDSLEKALVHVDGLTDLVFCLPGRPAKKDEEWINGLGPPRSISTKLWAAENFDAELAGLDELRSTFFGELVLSPDTLSKTHERSVAPVKARWLPPLHTSNHVERQLERILLRPNSFDTVEASASAIADRVAVLREALDDIDDDAARADADAVADDLLCFIADVRAFIDAGRSYRTAEARDRIAGQEPPSTSPRKLHALVLELRKRRLPAALAVTGLAADIRDVVWWMQDARADSEAALVAVVADAGYGKTHLAAQLTAQADRPTAGVFVQGGRLRAGGSLDDLARRIPGLRVERFEDLLEALNSAGARAGIRVPLVIDGLNEAERPSEWRGLLDELVPVLGDYPNVLVIITLREVLATRAVPDSATTIELEWYRAEIDDMVAMYFDHYLIDAAGAWLPGGMFHNPLFLRMYCEAANPLRESAVGVEALPTSLVGLFERYRDVVVKRLAEEPARVAIPVDQIKRRLASLALAMWSRGIRRIASDEARAILDVDHTNWDESLFRRLEEEGVLFREEVDGNDDTEVGVLFDRFAGYLIADGLLARMSYSEVAERLSDRELWADLLGEDGRSFGDDVAVSLVGLVPRRFGGHHVWRSAPEEYRSRILAEELDVESEFLDDGTVEELEMLIVGWSPPRYGRRHPFDRLWEVRASPVHRLNANFLDRILRQLPVAERDRRWTEWIRYRADDVLVSELKELVDYWTHGIDRDEGDDLDALAIAWVLTSSSEHARDFATNALQRYGRPEPRRLFELGARMLDVDDTYVVERVIGAAFGAASSHQMPDPGGPFERALAVWLAELRDRYLAGGCSPNSHELLRGYVRATFELAGALHPGSVPAEVSPLRLEFAVATPVPFMPEDDANAAECATTFGMDFENYVVGRAIEGRGNYDFGHAGFRRARGEVMARVWELGWRSTLLGEVDRSIAEARSRIGREGKVERYGKKYGWIAYYELVGRFADSGRRARWVGGGRNVTVDIDPSFPKEPPAVPLALPEWAPTGSVNDEGWLRTGTVEVPAQLWSPDELYGIGGGWLLVEGFLEHRRDGRRVWGYFHTILLEPADTEPALKLIAEHENLGDDFLPALPSVRDVFAGEVPWSHRFDATFDDDDRPALRGDWSDPGIGFGQVAVELVTAEGASPTALSRSYDLPSFEFATRFNLRQLPGTLDLVGFDGVRASAAFRTELPWEGHLLFVRRSLLLEFADKRQIVQVGWGQREVTVEWMSPPAWVRSAHQNHENLWRDIRVLDRI